MTVTQQKIWSKTADQACENSLSPYLVTGSELQILDVLTTAQNHTHTHTRLTALFPGLPRRAGTRKVKPIWILLKLVSGTGISWAICKSAPCSRQTPTPAPHHSVFYRPDALPAAQPTVSKHWRHCIPLSHKVYSTTLVNSKWKVKL